MSACCNCGQDQSVEFVKLVVEYDDEAGSDCPCEWGGYEVVRPCGSVIGMDGDPKYTGEEIVELVDQGLAFPLDKYEHSGVDYSLHGEGYQCRWDTSPFAAVVVIVDEDYRKEKEEERLSGARNFLKTFNQWVNGEVYRYVIIESGHNMVGGCCRIYCVEDLTYNSVEDMSNTDVKLVKIEGDAATYFEDELEEALTNAGYTVL
jgi:hypothetical protein